MHVSERLCVSHFFQYRVLPSAVPDIIHSRDVLFYSLEHKSGVSGRVRKGYSIGSLEGGRKNLGV